MRKSREEGEEGSDFCCGFPNEIIGEIWDRHPNIHFAPLKRMARIEKLQIVIKGRKTASKKGWELELTGGKNCGIVITAGL